MTRGEHRHQIREAETRASLASKQAGHAAANLYAAYLALRGTPGFVEAAAKLEHLTGKLTELQRRINLASFVHPDMGLRGKPTE